jgi:gliding motility-associated-like protein
MNKFVGILFFCLFGMNFIPVQAQYPDNMDSVGCTITAESMTWGVRNAWSSPAVVSNLNIPLVGDLDGDGHPEIVCFSLAGQSHYLNDGYTGNVGFELLAYDGVTHALKATVTMESPVSEYDAAAYGLVRTSDDKGLIVVACYDNLLRAYDITSATPNTPYWVSDAAYASGTSSYAVNVSFADFNGDGHPEVYVRNKVYNAENGHLLAEASTTNTGSSYAHYTQLTHRKLSSPFAADVCGDSRPELILGNEIYEVSITNPNGTAGNALTLAQQVTPPGGAPADGNVQVADFNMDGFLDVFISTRNTDAHSGTVYCYVWDVHNGVVGNPLTINANRSGKSIPLIADIDNDGLLEMVLQCGASSGRQIQAYKYNTATQSFSLVWDMAPDEDSFSNSFTAFDFNQDGLLELVICDQSTLKIVNGSGQSHLTHNDTVPMYVLNTFPYTETTIMQYPVIADVDNDGSAELVSVGSSMLNILKSSGQPWAPARPVWNQYLYNVTNINRDLTVPSHLFNNATSFTDPDNIVRRPFNNFLQQATTLDQYGRPFAQLMNLAITGEPSMEFQNEEIAVEMEVCNTGGAPFEPPMYVTVYTDSGQVVQTVEFPTALQPGDCENITLLIDQSELKPFGNPYPLRIAINDRGEGTAQYGGLQVECDTSDNYCSIEGTPCKLKIPNIITPNNDGYNDVLVPKIMEGEYTYLRMDIYDRWGKRVWHQENADELLWDASKLSDGVYYCAIEYFCRITGRKKHLIHTSVTVIR